MRARMSPPVAKVAFCLAGFLAACGGAATAQQQQKAAEPGLVAQGHFKSLELEQQLAALELRQFFGSMMAGIQEGNEALRVGLQEQLDGLKTGTVALGGITDALGAEVRQRQEAVAALGGRADALGGRLARSEAAAAAAGRGADPESAEMAKLQATVDECAQSIQQAVQQDHSPGEGLRPAVAASAASAADVKAQSVATGAADAVAQGSGFYDDVPRRRAQTGGWSSQTTHASCSQAAIGDGMVANNEQAVIAHVEQQHATAGGAVTVPGHVTY